MKQQAPARSAPREHAGKASPIPPPQKPTLDGMRCTGTNNKDGANAGADGRDRQPLCRLGLGSSGGCRHRLSRRVDSYRAMMRQHTLEGRLGRAEGQEGATGNANECTYNAQTKW